MIPSSNAARRLERASRVAIVLSACGALAFQTWLGARAWEGFTLIVALSVALGAACAVFAPRLAWSSLAFLSCLFPTLLHEHLRGLGAAAYTPVLALVLGAALGFGRKMEWAIPAPWRGALVLWALSIAMVWPVVAAREMDFAWALLHQRGVAVTALRIAPHVEISWILNVVLCHLVGVLWFDALFATFAGRAADVFERWVLMPFVAGASVSAAVAVVQTVYDARILNPSRYGAIGRAAGLMRDGNVFAVVSAMWGAAALAIAVGRNRRPLWLGALFCFAITTIAVWGSASRTGLLVLLCVLAAGGLTVWRGRIGPRWAIPAVAAVLLAGAMAAAVAGVDTGPLRRIAKIGNQGSISGIAKHLWQRDRYGTYSMAMIRDYPVTGVGVGMFHSLASDYSVMDRGRGIGPDNAQSWYRHQLAETGVLGSVGWLAWLALLVPTLLARDKPGPRWLVAGALVGLGLASLVGMPTQHITGILTMWTLVFWHAGLSGAPDQARRHGWRIWAAVWMVAAGFAFETARLSLDDLRVPQRALRAGWRHEQGFLRQAGDGLPRGARLLEGRAKAVIQVRGEFLRVQLYAPDTASHGSLRVRILRAGQTVATVAPQGTGPTTVYIRAPQDRRFMMIELERSDEPAAPSAARIAVGRWRFVKTPPIGALTVE